MSDFTSLSIKAQNERVLHFLCSSVGNASQVLSVEDTLQGVSQLRARKILQRPLLKVVLTIGDIRLAVQMFSKAQEEKFPTLKRVTTDGVGVGMASEYVRVGGEEHQGPIQPGDHVKAFRYGRGLIPCTEADLDAMKLHGLRSLEAVAFVPREEVPPYILMGGVKAILPLAGDHTGQKGFACIVRSMLELNRVLIVRHVRTRDAAPSLAVCFPSDQDGDCLYFAPLPFSEDVRPFRFSNYEEVQCTAAEERMIDNMIDALTVEETVLMPSETFNPSLQQYYGTLRSKLMSKEESDVPPLLPTLQASSTAFNAFGNPLQPVLEKALPVLDKVAAAFPFAEVDPAKAGDRRSHWFRLSSGVTPDGQDDNSTSDRAPSTVNAFLLKSKNGAKTGEGSVVSTSDVSTIAAEGLATTVKHVTTVDPVGSFEALLANAKQDGVARLTAMDEITEVILQLLRYSLKSAHYDKCDDALQALRQCCVHENDPDYYNSFLMKLSVETREMGSGTTTLTVG
ncbi:ATP-dependent DNA helicase 2 subunit 2 [Angomonas deanei]|uniref:Ku70/Ku80 beta-barrel domain/Ku C terminal domain like, putative n=1 Tax=Angomonas deanei TaxID=59799 RepID=A0A7G2CFY5_9TRYP|nr:ATP-dependent DNA helicase 2 subunit 2 [Angomonas deanei]CAD2218275.1 Ku70/Ku80 beta-barrel domain/Ku C terminal domain like, putative [Angomonas deanei]|eukprot:EPY35323.1 ATP-dependent DNA helicase 2 subunit 2 [Angomonas deanei]